MYDPLHDKSPGCGQAYPASYWTSTVDTPGSTSPLSSDKTCDVAVIGAGYTGLSCALHLAKDQGANTVLLEANQTAWGCSGRNAGFILPSSGRLPFSQMTKKWGETVMRGIYAEFNQGVELVEQLVANGIDCDRQPTGYLKMAHKPNQVKPLYQLADLITSTFNRKIEKLSRQQVFEQFGQDQQCFGAIRYDNGFGVNPLKLALGYAQQAQEHGAQIHTGSPVQAIEALITGGYRLHTPTGLLTAKKVVIATNGYTPKQFHPAVDNRILPVLSQIIVTRPLSEQELLDTGLKTTNVVMDTRALKYYYRKLPDNRILFGGRGAISGKDAEDPYFATRLLSVLQSSYPQLKQLTIDYAWSGWICMALDDLPHLAEAPAHPGIVYGMGYCGSGVSFSALMGKRLAEKAVGKPMPDLPLYNVSLPRFPLAPLRRVGQWGYFQYGLVKDRFF